MSFPLYDVALMEVSNEKHKSGLTLVQLTSLLPSLKECEDGIVPLFVIGRNCDIAAYGFATMTAFHHTGGLLTALIADALVTDPKEIEPEYNANDRQVKLRGAEVLITHRV